MWGILYGGCWDYGIGKQGQPGTGSAATERGEITMSGGLRYNAGRDMPPGMQELLARHYLGQKATQILTQENTVLLAVMAQVDIDCQFCAHAGHGSCENTTETVEATVEGCISCSHTECSCHTCHDNSKYIWCGAEEALNRLALMQEERT